jgi:hypothetical protein
MAKTPATEKASEGQEQEDAKEGQGIPTTMRFSRKSGNYGSGSKDTEPLQREATDWADEAFS